MDEKITTMDDILKKEKEARKLVKRKAVTSSIAAVVPIPFLDMGTDMKLMNEITDDIEAVFNIEHDHVFDMRDDLMIRSTVMATSLTSEFIVKRMTPFVFNRVKNAKMRRFRVVKIVGVSIGGVISYFLMKKLGDTHIDKCVKYLKEQVSS